MSNETFTNLASTTVTTGGTTAPAQGTIETWVVASGATFAANLGSTGASKTQFHVQEDDIVKQSEIFLVIDTGIGSLTTALTNGQTGVVSLAVSGGITSAITSGDTIVLNNGTSTQAVVASASQIVGATSVAVNSFTSNAAYGIGTLVRDATHPGTAAANTIWLVTRGSESTTPIAHTAGFTIVNTVVASYLNTSPLPTGTVLDFAGSSAPTGFLLCSGQAVSRYAFPALFAIIGTTWGAGDGSTTFNVPDLRGRITPGLDNLGGTAAGVMTGATTLGGTGGEQTHALSTAELAAHNHTASDSGHTHTASDSGHTHPVSDTGHTHAGVMVGHSHTLTQGTAWAGIIDGASDSKLHLSQVTASYTSSRVASMASNATSESVAQGTATGVGGNTDSNGSLGTSSSGSGGVSTTTGNAAVSTGTGTAAVTTGNNGSGTAHNNLQPYAMVTKIIKT